MIRNRLHHHRLIAICVFVFHVHLSQCNTTTSSVFKVNDPGSKSSIYEEIILLDAFDNQIDQFDDSVAGTISSSSESSSISTSFTALPDLDASLEWISDKALLMANVRQISVCALDTPKRRCLSELYYLIDLKFGSAGKPFNDSELNVTCR